MPRKRVRGRRKNKKTNVMLIVISIILFIILFISVIFSIINMKNNKIVKGVKIGTIDVSNLTQEEAKNKIEKWYKEVVQKNIEVDYKEIKENIEIANSIEKIDIDKLVKQANVVGKSGNIIKDNYEILNSLLFSKKIENDIKINDEEINKIIEKLNKKLPDAMIESNYYIDGDKLVITKGNTGFQIDSKKFKENIEGVLLEEENRKFDLPVIKVNPKQINIEEIYEEIYKDAKDAYIVEEPIEVHPEVNGVDFNISIEEAKNIILEENKTEYIIPLSITIPEVTLEKLGSQAFPEKIAEYSTAYSTSNENREINLKLASEKLDGTIILPGETFSYNKVVGERTIAKGYKEAAVYSGGKVVDGIGGGICQLSSTLYNTAIYANLEILQRSNHRFLTSYVTAGRDATVSWGTIDFCFKNTRKYPIKIVSTVKNGVVTTEIYGIKEEKEYEIAIESKIIETLPFTINYVKDYNLEQGVEEIKQYGANGAKSETYKIVKEDGVIIERTLISSDTYSPLERIVKKGVKKVQGVNAKPAEEENEQLKDLNPDLLEQIKELD